MSDRYGHVAIRVRLDQLALCRLCGQVHGEVTRTLPETMFQGLRQVCDCVTAPPAETWPGYDFNKAVELCRCCGRRLLMSGLHYSEWFCESCISGVETINRICGSCVIPTGRHALMKFAQDHLADPAPSTDVSEELGDYFDRVERLEAYAQRISQENLALIADGDVASTDVPLAQYLGALPASPTNSQAAVFALGRAFHVPAHVLVHCC